MKKNINLQIKENLLKSNIKQQYQVDLLRQLYERKFFSPLPPTTVLQKIKHFQKKVKSNQVPHTLRAPHTHQIISKSFTSMIRENIRYNQSQNFASQLQLQRKKQRSMMDNLNHKKGQSKIDSFRENQYTQSKDSWTASLKQNQMSKSLYIKKNSSYKWRSHSREVSTSNQTPSGRSAMQKHQKIRIRALEANSKLRQKQRQSQKQKNLLKPSKIVFIGGKNLSDQAEDHRKKNKAMEQYMRQLQKYAKEFKSLKSSSSPKGLKKSKIEMFNRNVGKKNKINNLSKNQNTSFSKQNFQAQKGQFADIQPWAVFDHQIF